MGTIRVLLRLQMRLPSLDVLRLLKPRLGFGGAEVCPEPALAEVAIAVQPEQMAVVQEQVSLIRLSEQLDQELAQPPALPSEILDSADVTEPVTPTAPTPDPRWELPPAPKVRAAVLEGCRVGAIGFGRQDIAGLAGAMLEKRILRRSRHSVRTGRDRPLPCDTRMAICSPLMRFRSLTSLAHR